MQCQTKDASSFLICLDHALAHRYPKSANCFWELILYIYVYIYIGVYIYIYMKNIRSSPPLTSPPFSSSAPCRKKIGPTWLDELAIQGVDQGGHLVVAHHLTEADLQVPRLRESYMASWEITHNWKFLGKHHWLVVFRHPSEK